MGPMRSHVQRDEYNTNGERRDIPHVLTIHLPPTQG